MSKKARWGIVLGVLSLILIGFGGVFGYVKYQDSQPLTEEKINKLGLETNSVTVILDDEGSLKLSTYLDAEQGNNISNRADCFISLINGEGVLYTTKMEPLSDTGNSDLIGDFEILDYIKFFMMNQANRVITSDFVTEDYFSYNMLKQAFENIEVSVIVTPKDTLNINSEELTNVEYLKDNNLYAYEGNEYAYGQLFFRDYDNYLNENTYSNMEDYIISQITNDMTVDEVVNLAKSTNRAIPVSVDVLKANREEFVQEKNIETLISNPILITGTGLYDSTLNYSYIYDRYDTSVNYGLPVYGEMYEYLRGYTVPEYESYLIDEYNLDDKISEKSEEYRSYLKSDKLENTLEPKVYNKYYLVYSTNFMGEYLTLTEDASRKG